MRLNQFGLPPPDPVVVLLGRPMRLTSSRRQDLGLAAGVGFCLGIYVLPAFAFYWLMQPTVSENYGIAAYEPPPATIVVGAPTASCPLPATLFDFRRRRWRLVGGYAVVFADSWLHQPIKGEGREDVDPEAEADSSCQDQGLAAVN